MRSAYIEGRFVHENGEPVLGRVKFTPSKIWLDDDDGNTYPCLAPEVTLEDGAFTVEVTRTDTYIYPWFYTVDTPLGTFTIWVEHDGVQNLKGMLPRTAT